MPTDTPAARPSAARAASGRYAPSHFVIRVGSEWSPIRAAAIWPIADVLAAHPDLVSQPGLDAANPASASSAADVGLVLDLIDSGMIAPPRRCRRRERAVSSRAVFYQATEA